MANLLAFLMMSHDAAVEDKEMDVHMPLVNADYEGFSIIHF